MTIFARRRLQTMLDELAPAMDSEKSRDILRRLNNEKQVDQALPAEMEVALLWAIKSLGDLEVEPEWWGDSKRPDAITDALVPGRTTAIEIAATNDNAISGEEAMDAIALQISYVANRARSKTGSHLYFRFREESGYVRGQYVRRRLAPVGLKLSEDQRSAVTDWIKSESYRADRLRLRSDGLDVEVEYTKRQQIRFHNIHSSMPPETHSLEENPLFGLLLRKSRQLRAATDGTLRILFLADVGSTLLNRIGRVGEIDHTQRFISARQIIYHFLQKRSRCVDAVVTFSPHKELTSLGRRDLAGREQRCWAVSFFGTTALPDPPAALQELAAVLPEPHYEGYQARSLFRQGSFSPARTGRYLGMTMCGNLQKKTHSIEFPARMLLDLLAGRLTEERFRMILNGREGNRNVFESWLNMGLTISGAEMAPRSIDEDDDHLILHFTDDPAARPFQRPGLNESER